MQEDGSLLDHLSTFKEIITNLEAMEVNYDDEDLGLILLCSLPSSYSNFRDTILYSRDTLTLHEVYEALHAKEKMKDMVSTEGSSSKGESLALKNKEKRAANQNPKPNQDDEGKATYVAENNSNGDVLVAFAGILKTNDEWILDSACTFHISPNRSWFTNYQPIEGGSILMGDNAPYKVTGIGSIQIKMFDGVVITLSDVRHVRGLKRNLISLSTLDLKGYKYSGEGGVLKVSKGAMIVMKADIKSANLYHLRGTTVTGNSNVTSNSSSISDTTNLWHMRLGHMSELGLTTLSKRGLLDGQCVGKLEFCEHCIFGKHKRVKFNTSVHTTKGILEYVHADLWGPSQEASLGGARYMLTIIDDYSRRVWPYFLKLKSEAFSTFKEWKVMVENQTGKKIKKLRTDNGMEFCSNEFNSYCKLEGIVRHYTVSHTPQQNGVAEQAASTACYLINMSPSIPLDKKTPIEVWSGSPANYSDLRIFGCPAYAHVDNGKLEPRETKCIFLGYKSGVKGYKLWCPETKKVEQSVNSEHTLEKENSIDQNPSVEQESSTPTPTHQPQRSIATDRPRRDIHPPKRLIEEANIVAYVLNVAEEIEGIKEPSTYTEAITSEHCNKWITAMHDEMESLEKNGTWELVKLPKEKKPVRCKWIFKRKEGITPNEEARFKAKLVAKGYSQIPGIDFTDVFTPVVKHSSIRTLLSIVAMHNYELEQLDVKTAFLHGELEEDIYMEQPEGFIIPGKENLVCRLKKSLYGLKQSPRQWYKRFDSFMLSHNFKRSDYDSCVYLKSVNGSSIYLLLYVDDMLIAAKDKLEIAKLKAQLSKEFEMTDLGPAKKILGMEITRNRQHGKLYLSQKRYIEKVLQRFNMHKAKPVSTPLAAHFKLSSAYCPKTDDEINNMAKVLYSSAVGSLMYAMVCSRPDLSHALSVVSIYMANPGKEHWKAVQWILRYLCGTSNACLQFGSSGEGLVGYVDSDYARDLDKRRSLTGYVFTIGGCAVSWKASLQTTIALSTTEAEYIWQFLKLVKKLFS
ncbi:hypothetical protein L2E82_03169 [Cichorium intybus]|uniref:Uncharacterized protein n=1 Tax=Cichorium intybus TaxID=13427 RepID=A0ACB9H333_CICIN|nr:hypothetical protein L2E82_03169 [Cichorium intybus]